MQSMSIGFAIALVVIMLATAESLVTILPLLAIYAFAVQRMTPNLQAVFQGVAQIRYMGHTVDALHRDMTEMPPPPTLPDHKAMRRASEVLPFKEKIEIQALSFGYPSSREPVLRELSLTIEKNTTVGFVGTTGCGKTTLVDVIMGLLEPTAGAVVTDGNIVNPSAPSQSVEPWQRNFGYVPQQIYLSDDTVSANIAFGIPEVMRDERAIEDAARVANLHEFVTTEMPRGYETVVGERGIRLSGGQRQRVGIARALYHDPDILVMDEATSALDSVTEEAVMDAIHNLMHTKTIIIIAHRITTVRECDMICLMEQGRIVAQGSYDELLGTSERFRAMAKVTVSG
jgi:ABC-type multidrug transport system fused ATPase/permease subunit